MSESSREQEPEQHQAEVMHELDVLEAMNRHPSNYYNLQATELHTKGVPDVTVGRTIMSFDDITLDDIPMTGNLATNIVNFVFDSGKKD